jgi:hypothetical protein
MGVVVLSLVVTYAIVCLCGGMPHWSSEEQDFERHKRRLEAMSPTDCRLTIDRMFDEAHRVVRQPKYVSLNWDAVRVGVHRYSYGKIATGDLA